MTDDPEQFRQRIDQLESKFSRLEDQIHEMLDSLRSGTGGKHALYPRVFPAALNNDGLYQEVDVGNDAIVAFSPDGRIFSENDLLANDTLGSSGFIEIPGSSEGDPVLWKVLVGSSEKCAKASDLEDENDLLVIADSTEGSEAADTIAWDRDDGVPVDLWAMTRVAYYDAGDETLYGYVRKISFDTCGKVYAISGETRVAIDVPCEEEEA